MTPDEARKLFSAALDDELDEEKRAAFEAALASSAPLASEWDEFRELMREAHQLGEEEDETPDLLAGVQRRLRVRSRGRFYRDRFATESHGRSMLPIVLGLVMLLAVAVAWITMRFVRVEAPPTPPASSSTE